MGLQKNILFKRDMDDIFIVIEQTVIDDCRGTVHTEHIFERCKLIGLHNDVRLFRRKYLVDQAPRFFILSALIFSMTVSVFPIFILRLVVLFFK